MMNKLWTGAVWIAAVAAAIPLVAQQRQPENAVPLTIVSTVPPELAAGVVLKEIDDPGSGVRWLLVEDPAHPGGPGRMVAVRQSGASAEPRAPAAAKTRPVLRSGDAVQVEEHSAVVDASLQGVALSAARAGERLRVRLRVGGRVVTAVALGPGRAALEPMGEAQ